MNIDNLTIGELKQLQSLLGGNNSESLGLNSLVGNKVIIRTYSAGVHFGELVEKAKNEVILKNARRLWKWKTNNNGISLSEVANSGLDNNQSKVCELVSLIWLEAIEIIPCSEIAIKNIEAQNVYKA